jgi:hypothetical protein
LCALHLCCHPLGAGTAPLSLVVQHRFFDAGQSAEQLRPGKEVIGRRGKEVIRRPGGPQGTRPEEAAAVKARRAMGPS